MTSTSEPRTSFTPGSGVFLAPFSSFPSAELDGRVLGEETDWLQAAEIPIRPEVDMPIKPGIKTPPGSLEEPNEDEDEDEVDMPIKPSE